MPIQRRISLFEIPQATTTTDIGRSGVARGYITPATTFTATTASSAAAGTKTTLTSAGAHGLTSAVAVGKTIYISAGMNWTAGFYNISSIDLDTTGVAITIDVAFNAGFGSPTIALAGTAVTFWTIQIPPLGPYSHIDVDASWAFSGSTNLKTTFIKLNTTTFYNPGFITASQISSRPSSLIIQNRGATNTQVNSQGAASPAQNSATTVPVTTGSVDTSVATLLTIGGTSNTANEFVYLERYNVMVFK